MNILPLDTLEALAQKVGTPYWLLDANVLNRRIATMKEMAAQGGARLRYAMKALACTRVLNEMRRAGIWIDTVSGNEVLRALKAGFPGGYDPPVVQLTADVFRDPALDVVVKNNILVNIGSPAMVDYLRDAGWHGPIAVRVNPGFGHGHINSCDTGGPSSKHGIWPDDLPHIIAACKKAGFPIIMVHAHIGTGPKGHEYFINMKHLGEFFTTLVPQFTDVHTFSIGGGLPFNYHEDQAPVDYTPFVPTIRKIREELSVAAGREISLEVEPGRFYTAPAMTLITRVKDVKKTRTNKKGSGQTFAMVDAGFADMIRPAMYGSYHAISIPARANSEAVALNVAGPLCESGDVFTRDEHELLVPRQLPLPHIGDLLLIHDVGAYGYSMSSNYNSIGRAPILWRESDGKVTMIARRETVDDLLRIECEEDIKL